MASLSKVLLIGNLTRDPELRYTTGGAAVVTFTLATNHRYSTASGESKEEVSFIRVTVWGKMAENCGKYLSKGRPVFVEGRLKQNNWETEKGEKRSTLEVVAQNVQFLGGRATGSDIESGGEANSPGNDDIPF